MLKVAIEICNRIVNTNIQSQIIRPMLAAPKGYLEKDLAGLSSEVPIVNIELRSVAADDPRILKCVDPNIYPCAPNEPEKFLYPWDAANAVMSADAWISLTGLYQDGPLLPWRPYTVFAPDFIQRYVPEIYGDDVFGAAWQRNRNQNITMRGAKMVFATTPQSQMDATVFAGVPRANVKLFPLFHDANTGRNSSRTQVALEDTSESQTTPTTRARLLSFDATAKRLSRARHAFTPSLLNRRYFVWPTNSTQHKNHLRALDALETYYNSLGGQLDVLICGPTSHLFADINHSSPYIREVAQRISALSDQTGKVMIIGEVPHELYDTLVKRAQFLWHNVVYDNGTFSVIEAAELGTPAVSSSYPQMRYIADLYGLKPRWFDPLDSSDAAAALFAEEHSQTKSVSLGTAPDWNTQMQELPKLLLEELVSQTLLQIGTAQK